MRDSDVALSCLSESAAPPPLLPAMPPPGVESKRMYDDSSDGGEEEEDGESDEDDEDEEEDGDEEDDDEEDGDEEDEDEEESEEEEAPSTFRVSLASIQLEGHPVARVVALRGLLVIGRLCVCVSVCLCVCGSVGLWVPLAQVSDFCKQTGSSDRSPQQPESCLCRWYRWSESETEHSCAALEPEAEVVFSSTAMELPVLSVLQCQSSYPDPGDGNGRNGSSVLPVCSADVNIQCTVVDS